MGSCFVGEVTVIGVEPSVRGAGLVDLTLTLWCENALAGAERVWELLRRGHLNRTGMWHELAPEDRHAWLSVALWSREYQCQGRPDAPAGEVFTLDGRHIVDKDSFYCAIGEAVNGPGGYFGRVQETLGRTRAHRRRRRVAVRPAPGNHGGTERCRRSRSPPQRVAFGGGVPPAGWGGVGDLGSGLVGMEAEAT